MKHIAPLSQMKDVPAQAVSPQGVAKYLAQILNLASAAIGVTGSLVQLQQLKFGGGS